VKILLDENLPHELRPLLWPHEVYTVSYQKWKGVRNGDLLREAAEAGFDAIITVDQGMKHEQALDRLPLSIVLLHVRRATMEAIRPLVGLLIDELSKLRPRSFVEVPRGV
jgi:hypothetical protein